MERNFDKKTFFEQSFFHAMPAEKNSSTEQKNQEQAALIIQRWWRQQRLKQTATESFEYLNHIISLQQAYKISFSKLENLILAEKTQKSTHTLLMHLEQTKDFVLPLRNHLSHAHHAERIFLSAYLITTKPEHLFESPEKIDSLLFSQAEAMLESFEVFCVFLSELYVKKIHTSTSTLSKKIPSAEQILAISDEKMSEEPCLMIEGRRYLDEFHQNQLAYYETFSQWESKNRHKLAKTCTAYYMQLESKRFAIVNNFDPRQRELYDGYGIQQKILKKRIFNLIGDDGIKILEQNLKNQREKFAVNKWITTPTELMVHELALNPEFVLSLNSCIIHPQQDLDTAIFALSTEYPDLGPMLEVLEEICNQLTLFIPHNKKYIEKLQKEFRGDVIKKQIEVMGLHEGLYTIIYSLLGKIKELESPAHEIETVKFLDELQEKIGYSEHDPALLLKQSLDFIYHKMSQINLETSTFYINQARELMGSNITIFEQKKLQERLSKNQFDLTLVLNWLDKIASAPNDYQLTLNLLCSPHVGSYIARILLIKVLQHPEHSILQIMPELFYLDQIRIEHWHAKYQQIFYTLVALNYLEIICAKYSVTLSSDELVQQKEKLMMVLETAKFTPKELAEYLMSILKESLLKKNKILSPTVEQILEQLIENIHQNNGPIVKFANKNLCDSLSFYLFKGYLPESSNTQIKWYGLQKELKQLSQEIKPMLQLHTKVHGEFYQKCIEERLWKPLFIILKATQIPLSLPPLLTTAEEEITYVHTYLHKMAFVLTGLTLIQQTVAHTNMWNLNIIIRNSTIKNLAYSFGLIDVVKDAHISKDIIAEKLMMLMKHIAKEQELTFDKSEEHKLAKMFLLAKQGQSPGYKSFLDELVMHYRQNIIRHKALNLNPSYLIAEFKKEVLHLEAELKEIIINIKKNLDSNSIDPVSQILPTLRTGK